MHRGVSKRAKTLRAWHGNMVGRWGKWSTVRGASWLGMPRGRGLCSSLNGFACLTSGLARRMPPDERRAGCLRNGGCRRSRHWRRPCCSPAGRKRYGLAGISWLLACTAIARMFWRRLMPVGGRRLWWLSRLRRAAGSSGRPPRSRPIGRKAKNGQNATCVRRPAPRKVSRGWPPRGRPGRGIGGQSRQGPQGRLRTILRVTA